MTEKSSRKSAQTTTALHPYVRLSHPDQRKGGGMERQLSANLQRFADLHGFFLGKKIYVDDGVSAWKGLNATPNHELGKFLADARAGTVKSGDCLVVENWDRLSRQSPWAAVSLANDLRQLGIHLGRLDTMRLLHADSADAGDFFDYALEAMRGHSESNAKSMRNGAAWQRKREAARNSGRTITHRLPSWVKIVDEQRVAKPGPARAIKRIFQLAANGYGHNLIAKQLTAEKYEPFGRTTRWCRSYVALLLSDRRVLGEFQPKLRSGEPAGDPIPDYYPAVISQEEWLAARVGSLERKNRPGRRSVKHLNIFAGLLTDALSGSSYYRSTRTDHGRFASLLIQTSAAEGREPARSFPLETFEAAILSRLEEIKPEEILGDRTPDEVDSLKNELTCLRIELEASSKNLQEHGFSEVLAEHVRYLEGKRKELQMRLDQLEQAAPDVLRGAWKDCHNLLTALQGTDRPEETRPHLQSVLRRIVAQINLLVVSYGKQRLCLAQILFKSGIARYYAILHYPPKANAKVRTPGYWQVESWRTDLPVGDLSANFTASMQLKKILDGMLQEGRMFLTVPKHPLP